MGLRHVLLFVALFALGYAKDAKFSKCPDAPADRCTVNAVRIEPCSPSNPCVVKKEHENSISFDFTPEFAATKMKTMVYLDTPSLTEFKGFGSQDACDYTSCPAAPGIQQTFNYNLLVSKIYPKGKFNLLWKVWNEDNADEDVCCFKFTIKIK